jgi:hypothetical protein
MVYNIKMNLREIGWVIWTGVIWFRIGQWRTLVDTVTEL